MRKVVYAFGGVLLCCVAVSLLSNVSFVFGKKVPVRNTMRAASSTATLANRGSVEVRLAEQEKLYLDTEDNAPLLAKGEEVLTALKEGDYVALSQMVHPVIGVTFTPYSTVEPESDLCFLPTEIEKAAEDKVAYLWGFTDGQGEHISMTIPEYVQRYVYNADYLSAPECAVDQIIAQGNALENVAEVFDDCRFIEYHFPGIDPGMEQFDWCSLKLVFAPYEKQWYLVGLVHSEWTI